MALSATPQSAQVVDNWSAQVYNKNASFVYSSAFTTPVLNLLAPLPGEKILDLGCGSCEITLGPLYDAVGPTGKIVGVDSSADLLKKGEAHLGEKKNVELVLLDGQKLGELKDRGEAFDAVFSNAALHWMKEADQVSRGVYKVLKKGGRYAAEMGGYLNMVGVRSTLHSVLQARGHDSTKLDPWIFPTPAAYTKILEEAGFRVEYCELIPRITPLPTGLAGWLETFAFSFTDHLSAEEKKEVIDEVCKKLEVDLKHDDGWEVMYVRLRFKAWKD